MSDDKRIPFFGMEVEPDALVQLFFHAPLAGEADLTGGVVRSGGRWWGGGRLKVYASDEPGDPRDERWVGWADFDNEDEATAYALKAFHDIRQSAKKVEKERGLEPLGAYLTYPRTTPDGFCQWAKMAGLPFFHNVERPGSQGR
jgi:hypothetical protein